jgi:hypothetical protein
MVAPQRTATWLKKRKAPAPRNGHGNPLEFGTSSAASGGRQIASYGEELNLSYSGYSAKTRLADEKVSLFAKIVRAFLRRVPISL